MVRKSKKIHENIEIIEEIPEQIQENLNIEVEQEQNENVEVESDNENRNWNKKLMNLK